MNTAAETLQIRAATLDDLGAMEQLIEASVRTLQAGDYTAAQLDGALRAVYGVDRQLIRDGTYFVVVRGGRIVGCGGWSRRRTLYGGDAVAGKDDSALQPGVDAARIRAFFVAPDCARQGIGGLLLAHCEQAAQAYGFSELELAATLTGVALYRRYGFAGTEREEVPLPGGLTLPVVRMRKSLAPGNA